jgi:hypothetical protein
MQITRRARENMVRNSTHRQVSLFSTRINRTDVIPKGMKDFAIVPR